MRHVVVRCDGACGVEMTLDLMSDKADGGFHSCDIEHELSDCSWVHKDGKDFCDECAAERTIPE